MLKVAQVEEVLRLAAQKISQREIARRTGISRASVSRIARGQWRPHVPSEEMPQPLRGTRRRCKSCGALVTEPCVACRARSARRHRHELRSSDEGPGPLIQLELIGGDGQRYQVLHAEKVAAELLAAELEAEASAAGDEAEHASAELDRRHAQAEYPDPVVVSDQ